MSRLWHIIGNVFYSTFTDVSFNLVMFFTFTFLKVFLNVFYICI